MKSKILRRLALSAVMAALVFLLTLLVRIPAPLGYVHLGDAAVCLAAALLPAPYAAAAAAVGAAMSDLAGGFAVYMIPTALIKAAMTLAFTRKGARILCRRNLLAALIAALITPAGYVAADAVLLALAGGGSLLSAAPWAAAAADLPYNALQGAASLALFTAAALLLDRLGFKARLDRQLR